MADDHRVDPTGQLQDLRHCRPLPVKKTFIIVNNFIVNTTRFLNRFSDIVDEKLTRVGSNLSRLENTLNILETKLNSVPDLDAAAPPPVAANTGAQPAAAAPDPALAPAPAPAHSGVKAKDDPSYARYFKLRKLGMPVEQIKLKLSAETDLDPNMLDTPEAFLPVAGAAPAANAAAAPIAPAAPAPDTPALENAPAPPMEPAEPEEPAVLTVKEDPAFSKYFKMLAVGIPNPVVKHKMTMEGFDGSLLDTPNAPSPNAGAIPIVEEEGDE